MHWIARATPLIYVETEVPNLHAEVQITCSVFKLYMHKSHTVSVSMCVCWLMWCRLLEDVERHVKDRSSISNNESLKQLTMCLTIELRRLRLCMRTQWLPRTSMKQENAQCGKMLSWWVNSEADCVLNNVTHYSLHTEWAHYHANEAFHCLFTCLVHYRSIGK